MGDYIVLGIVAIVLVAVIIYIVKQKKSGAKCIGCPYGKNCNSCNCNCSAQNQIEDKIN